MIVQLRGSDADLLAQALRHAFGENRLLNEVGGKRVVGWALEATDFTAYMLEPGLDQAQADRYVRAWARREHVLLYSPWIQNERPWTRELAAAMDVTLVLLPGATAVRSVYCQRVNNPVDGLEFIFRLLTEPHRAEVRV